MGAVICAGTNFAPGSQGCERDGAVDFAALPAALAVLAHAGDDLRDQQLSAIGIDARIQVDASGVDARARYEPPST